MSHNGTAIVFDASIELPTNVMTDNMFVISRNVQIGTEKRRLHRGQTAAMLLLKATASEETRLLPLSGNDVRSTLEAAQEQHDQALIIQSKSADLQTRQSLKMASRSIFGDAAQLIVVETESVALVAALQLIARPARHLTPGETAKLLTKLLKRMPTWFYAPSATGIALFGGGRFVLEQAQVDGEPTPFRITVSTQSQFVNALAESVLAHDVQGKIVYLRHAGCEALVEAIKMVFGDAVEVKSAETNSAALTARFGRQFLEVVLMEPTQTLIDLTNRALKKKLS